MAIRVVQRAPIVLFAEGVWKRFWKFVGFLFLAGFVAQFFRSLVAQSLTTNTTVLGIVEWVAAGPVLLYALRRPLRRIIALVRPTTAPPIATPPTSLDTLALAIVGFLPALLRKPAGALYYRLRPAVGRWATERYFADADAPPAAATLSEKTPSDALYVGERLDADGGPIVLAPEQRARHTYVIGQSGTGKTTLLKRLVIQDMEAGHGLAFIDPHGDAADDLLNYVPASRLDDVIYFNPTSSTCPPFNPFALRFDPPKLTADMLSVFQMFFGSSWGERLHHLMQQSLLTLLVDPAERHTFPHLRRLLLNDDFRAPIVARIADDSLREYWTTEFEAERASIPAITNKLGQFLVPMSPMLRVLSTPENALNFSAIMNEGKILIVNLSKGELGDDPSQLLGGLVVTGLQQAALARTAIPETQRRPFTLFVDEFQNYVVSSFATILSEARKYRLSLVLANQYLRQIETLRPAIFGNVGTFISFAVSPDDAAILHRNMHRSRITVRRRESTETVPVVEFVEWQKDQYRKALADKKYIGMDRDERRAYDQMFSTVGGAVKASLAYNARHAEIEQALHRLEHEELTVAVLRELFGSDFEFRDEEFPSVDEFLKLQPHHGVIRIGSVDNVLPFRAPLPDPPDAGAKERVLARLAERATPPSPPPAPNPQPVAPPDVPPPAPAPKDDDFHFRY